MKINVIYIPSNYRVKLWWFRQTQSANGIAEWEKVDE